MKTIKFKSIYSGKEESYDLQYEEDFVSSRCPIDGTNLISFKGNTGRDVWESRIMYRCPNCGNEYSHLEPEKLQHAKEIIIKERKKRLAELREHESRIIKLLEAAKK
jgi:predicted RNA-binding Zn-ribbon protein involved in translation (DUF1610 family)